MYDKYKVKVTESAVDLIKGIGLCAGLKAVAVEGATAPSTPTTRVRLWLPFNPSRKGTILYSAFEGPDECSHQGDLAARSGRWSSSTKWSLWSILIAPAKTIDS